MESLATVAEYIRIILYEPITEFNPLIIGIEYLLFMLLAGIAAKGAKKFYKQIKTPDMKKSKDGNFSLVRVLMAGPLEEMGFRGTIYMVGHVMLGFTAIPVLYVANAIWAGYHLRSFSTFIYTFVLGIYLTKFWTLGFDGLWWVAIIMHSLHNLLSYTASEFSSKDPDPRMKKPEESVTVIDPSS